MTFSWIRKIGTFMMLQKGKEGRECGDGGGVMKTIVDNGCNKKQ